MIFHAATCGIWLSNAVIVAFSWPLWSRTGFAQELDRFAAAFMEMSQSLEQERESLEPKLGVFSREGA